MTANASVSIGVIGCGTIASAIMTGIIKTQSDLKNNSCVPSISSISLSKRSENILDKADIIFLCVLNNQTTSVLEPLKFDAGRHTIVSLVATSKIDDLKDITGLDSDHVFKMICLPSIAKHEGCALFVPKTNAPQKEVNPKIGVILRFLDLCGGFVECETEEIMNVMITPTCLMGPLYGILRQNQEWLVKKGVPPQDATYFVGRQYASMIHEAEHGCHDNPNHFEDLVKEQTPGGLNEQALSNMTQLGIFGVYDKAMEAVLSRLHGDTDGSLPKDTKTDG